MEMGSNGFVMTCSRDTVEFCLKNLIFGGSKRTYSIYNRVQVGDIGFLINTSTDELYGIFEATSLASEPSQPWEPEGWGGRGATNYPVQIRVLQKFEVPTVTNQSRIWKEIGVETFQLGRVNIPRYSLLNFDTVESLLSDYFQMQVEGRIQEKPLSLSSVIQSTFSDLNLLQQRSNDTFYIYDYHKYWLDKENKVMNPNFDGMSSDILDVKQNEDNQVTRFSGVVQDLLNRDFTFVICVMPSHEIGTQPSGIRTIAKRVCTGNIIDGTDCLYRSCKMQSSHTSGSRRNYEEEFGSLGVQNENLIQGQPVLLLDDVTTTGVSFRAGKDHLLQAGGGVVICLALGMTVLE